MIILRNDDCSFYVVLEKKKVNKGYYRSFTLGLLIGQVRLLYNTHTHARTHARTHTPNIK